MPLETHLMHQDKSANLKLFSADFLTVSIHGRPIGHLKLEKLKYTIRGVILK